MNDSGMNEGALNLLGLCARARRLVTGEKAVVQAIRAGDCALAILDADTAKNGEKAVRQACQTHGVTLLIAPPGTLGRAIGKPGRMAAAITDTGFAGKILQLCQPAGGRMSPEA